MLSYSKGQIEVIAVLGLLVIAIVVVVLAFQLPSPTQAPQDIELQQSLVREHVIEVGMDGADLALKRIEETGGYIQNPTVSTFYSGAEVSYWSYCDQDTSPTLEEIDLRLENAVRNYIQNTIPSTQSFQGKTVIFDHSKLNVEANIVGGKIDFRVILPFSSDGFQKNEPYIFSIPTNLKELYSFGKDYAKEASANRNLEIFTLSSLYLSKLPTKGVMTNCGEIIYKSPEEISSSLKDIILYTLANTEWWVPMQSAGTGYRTYSFETVSGNKYTSLNPKIKIPSDFIADVLNPIFLINTEYLMNTVMIFSIPQCMKFYDQQYSVDYPAIVTLKDELSGNTFNIASYVFISPGTGGTGMEPGKCEEIPSAVQGCTNLDCSASFNVARGDGSPLEGVKAFFGSCLIGQSDSAGKIEGKTLCDTNEFLLIPPNTSFDFIQEGLPQASIETTHVLTRKPALKIDIKMIKLIGVDTTTYDPTDNPVDPLYVGCQMKLPSSMSDRYTSFTFIHQGTGKEFIAGNMNPPEEPVNFTNCRADPTACFGIAKKEIEFNYVPSGEQKVTAEIRQTDPPENGLNTPVIRGGFRTDFTLSPEDSTVYAHVPLGINRASATNSDYKSLGELMENTCGLEPLSNTTTTYSKILKPSSSCFTCEGLKDVFEAEVSSEASDRARFFTQNPIDGTWSCEETIGKTLSLIESEYNIKIEECAS